MHILTILIVIESTAPSPMLSPCFPSLLLNPYNPPLQKLKSNYNLKLRNISIYHFIAINVRPIMTKVGALEGEFTFCIHAFELRIRIRIVYFGNQNTYISNNINSK